MAQPSIHSIVFTIGDYARQSGEYKTIIVNVDFKATGQNIIPIKGKPNDLIWAYSIVVMRFNPTTRVARVIDIRQNIVKINKLPNETYEMLYLRNNWELRCAQENLLATDARGRQQNLERYFHRQKFATLNTMIELAECYNRDLTIIEQQASAVDTISPPTHLQYVWCTLEFDTLCASILLTMIGAYTMAYWRTGEYHGGGHFFHSYLCGKEQLSIDQSTWDNTCELVQMINNIAWHSVPDNYDLSKNAMYTCLRFLLAGLIEK